MKNLTKVFIIFVIFFYGRGWAMYRGLQFGSDTAAVKKVFPKSENQSHRVFRQFEQNKGVVNYTIIFPKGAVDSSRLYFVNNKFSASMEYWYPGRQYFNEAVKKLTREFGVLVKSGNMLYRRDGSFLVQLFWHDSSNRAIAVYSDERYLQKLQSILSLSRPSMEDVIDTMLAGLENELRQIDSTTNKEP